jgi:hypothetical protein
MSAGFQLAGVDTASLWHCVMLAGAGGARADHGGEEGTGVAMAADMPMDHGAPLGDGSGFCPVCSLTGCGAPSVVAQADFRYFPPAQGEPDGLLQMADAPSQAALYDRPQARAPPLSA